jgi:hypothetical protein
MKFVHKAIAALTGKNLASAPKSLIIDQMNEPRPLPLGMLEFDAWSDRIIAGAMVTADPMSQKFALAEMIMHLKPTDDHCNDGFFIKSLRKVASNQIALAKMTELRDSAKTRLAEQTAAQAVIDDANKTFKNTHNVVDLSRDKDGA